MTPEALAVTWGTNVRNRRMAMALTQKQLAEACGVKQHTISRIETGIHRPSDALRMRLAMVLGEAVENIFPFPSSIAVSPARRSANGRIGAYVTNSRVNTTANTRRAREAAFEHWVRQIDPRNELPRAEQVRRAESARRAHLSRIARLGHESRRRNKAAASR